MKNIDLHCHLDGSLPLEAIQEVLKRPISESDVQVPIECESLAEYLECFHLPLECMQTELGLEYVSYHFMASLAGDDMKYIEVRFAPMLSTIHGLSGEEVINAVIRGLNRGKKQFGIDYQIILCTMRHHPLSLNLEVLKLAKAFLGNGVCAVDIAGSEADYPMSLFRQLFLQASIWKIPFTIHAGECGNIDNVLEAIDLGATRIGHGIALSDHPEALALCREKQIPIEMCPTSNIQTKSVKDIKKYPLREFLEEGLLVTINTDNRTVSNTSIQNEFLFIQNNFGITDDEIILLKSNARKSTFPTLFENHERNL
ncbi:MAG: adenosine deaminase [Eubacteriales bacterium]